jgi:hypothetical protein
VNPANANPLSWLIASATRTILNNATNNFVSGNDRQPWRHSPPLDLIEFRVTYTTNRDLDEDFTLTGLRPGHPNQR